MREPLRVFARALGCPKARVDTERLLGNLGPTMVVESPAQAELVLVYTCGFIQPAVEESIGAMLQATEDAGQAQGQRPLVAAAGCLVSRYPGELAADMTEVDLWLPLDSMDRWPLLVAEALQRTPFAQGERLRSTPPGYAYLKISEGCNHACSFCAIPSIRGGLKSGSRQGLAAEAKALVGGGVKELVLVAQDLTAYGRDTGESLPGLLEDLASLDGLKWLRLMYLYPAGLTEEFLGFLKSLGPPLVPYFDIPVQHAHPDVLSRMGRPFAKDPRRVVDRVRKFFPEAALRTSVIVGFPGETQAHVQTLLDFVGEARFAHLGAFAFWPEQGTAAADMPDQVDEAEKQARLARVMELQEEVSEEFLAGVAGRELEVLIDAPSPEWPGLFEGRAWFQAPEVDGLTYVSAPPEAEDVLAPGTLVKARVEETHAHDLSALAGENA